MASRRLALLGRLRILRGSLRSQLADPFRSKPAACELRPSDLEGPRLVVIRMRVHLDQLRIRHAQDACLDHRVLGGFGHPS